MVQSLGVLRDHINTELYCFFENLDWYRYNQFQSKKSLFMSFSEKYRFFTSPVWIWFLSFTAKRLLIWLLLNSLVCWMRNKQVGIVAEYTTDTTYSASRSYLALSQINLNLDLTQPDLDMRSNKSINNFLNCVFYLWAWPITFPFDLYIILWFANIVIDTNDKG